MKRNTTTHPKMKRLARTLNIHRAHAIGIMQLLWEHVGDFAPMGDIGRLDNVEIAEAVGWTESDADRLVNALVECGWLDKSEQHRLLVHDWPDHAEEWVKKKLMRANLDIRSLYGGKTVSRRRRDGVPPPRDKARQGKAGQGMAFPEGGVGETVRPTKSQCMALYALYPRKADKGKALPAIDKAIRKIASTDGHPGKDDPIAWLQARVVAFAKSPLGQPPLNGGNDYRSYPTSWFNGERYDDDDSEWQRPNGDLRHGQGARSAADIRRERERADQYPIDTTPPRELV